MMLALLLAIDAVQIIGGVKIATMPPVVATGTFDITDRVGRALGVVSVSGSVAVTGTFWQATQPVSGTFWQATQPVSGTFWQATQPVSIAAALDISDRVGRALGVVASITNPVAVTGTFWQATQPVSGTFWQATQPVSATALPLPANAAQESSGNLASIASSNAATDARVASVVAVEGAQAPASAVQVSGQDDRGISNAVATTRDGATLVFIINATNKLLPSCNAVRRSNCR